MEFIKHGNSINMKTFFNEEIVEGRVEVHFCVKFWVYKVALDLVQGNTVLVLVLPLAGCVALNKSPHLSELQFPQL